MHHIDNPDRDTPWPPMTTRHDTYAPFALYLNPSNFSISFFSSSIDRFALHTSQLTPAVILHHSPSAQPLPNQRATIGSNEESAK